MKTPKFSDPPTIRPAFSHQGLTKDSEIKIFIPLLNGIEIGRHLFREYLLKQIKWSFELLPMIQSYNSPYLYPYFRLFTFLGCEDFYWGIFPVIYWALSPTVGRLLICLWAICVFVGDWLKNFLCLPRPPSHFVKGNQKSLDCHGFGWPSLHSIHAIALPFFAIRGSYGYLWDWPGADSEVLPGIERGGILICWCLALFWMFSVCLSRLYLGVHSPADVQGGLIVGGLILHFWSTFSESFDHWLTTSSTGVLWIVLWGLFFLSIIPHVEPVSVTDEELNGIVVWMIGFLSFTNLFPNLLQPPHELSFYVVFIRLCLGFATLATTYLMISFLWKQVVGEERKGEGLPPMTPLRVCKMFFKYGIGCGVPVVVAAPLLFNYLNV